MLTSEFITRTAQERLAPLGIHVSAPWTRGGMDRPQDQLADQYAVLSQIEFNRRGPEAFQIAYDFLKALSAADPTDRTAEALKIMASWGTHGNRFRKTDLETLESYWRDSANDNSLADIGLERFLTDVYEEHGDFRAIAKLRGTKPEDLPINPRVVRYG